MDPSMPLVKDENCFFGMKPKALLWWCLLTILAFALGAAGLSHNFLRTDSISAEEFSRIIEDFSEPGGYFFSDNFISNEEEYLKVVDSIKELKSSGGAYIGVGPEQNFTYIARLQPSIAFIVDVRRQAMIQQLMFKALFRLSGDRTDFLARLLSRPLKGPHAPKSHASIDELMRFFSLTPPDAAAFAHNLAEIKSTIRNDFKFPLSENDESSLDYVLDSFRTDGVYISFRMNSWGQRGYGHFPSMREILEQRDPGGKPGNFLADDEDYAIVRNLQRQNRIIPLVGDFAGPKTLKAVASYLKEHSCPVRLFYISNVEQFLFQNGVFDAYVKNVKALPINSKSLLIRSVIGRYRSPYPRPMMATLMQNLSEFLTEYDQGRYTDYWMLSNTPSIIDVR
jgi:hypothetical protein